MSVRKYNPTTNARRISSVDAFDDVTKFEPEKKLTIARKQQAGRSNGKIAVRHRGGGAKRRIRVVDFRRDKYDVPAKIVAIEYDPGRGARLALLHYADGEKRYILAPAGIKVGDEIEVDSEKTGMPPRELCLLIKRNMGSDDVFNMKLAEHMLSDLRVRWALDNGMTPNGKFPSVPGGSFEWAREVRAWAQDGMLCE